MLLSRVTSPAAPVPLSEIMEQLREPSDPAATIDAVRVAAHDMISEMSGRTLGAETWDLALATVGKEVALPRSPVQSLVSINYFDAAGVAQTATLGDFDLFKGDDRAIVRPKPGKAWPGLQVREDALTIRFIAGYVAMPDGLRMAVRLASEYLFDHRMEGVPMSIDALVSTHRIGWVSS